jgi:DNA polymerase-3 subunit alpha
MLAFWTAWLKVHYPLEFYAASLAKASNADSQFRLMRDALAHSIDVKPPSMGHSRDNWAPVPGVGLVAGWRQIPGIGPAMAPRIEEEVRANGLTEWRELASIPGIGLKTVESMEAFSVAKDPFGLYKTEKRLKSVSRFIRGQSEVPRPTHNGDQLAAMKVPDNRRNGRKFVPGPRVVYMGVVRRVEYKDIVEDERSRTGKEVEEILANLRSPELVKRATLHMYDTSEEEVYARINRWRFPKHARRLETIRVNHDVVVIVGNRIAGFGTPIMVDKIYVIDPEG